MLYLILYIGLIVGVNVGFAYVPMLVLYGGELWPPMSLVVGFVFVVRDYAQRQVGHHILWAMLVGCIFSWFLATPQLAVASATAFALGELVDWAIFTFMKKSFAQRILISSLIGTPVDTLVFLCLVGIATPVAFITMTLSKLLGAFIVYAYLRKKTELCSSNVG